jgi:hypothetical protein
MFDATGKMQPRAWPIMGAMALTSLFVVLASRACARRRSDAPSG